MTAFTALPSHRLRCKYRVSQPPAREAEACADILEFQIREFFDDLLSGQSHCQQIEHIATYDAGIKIIHAAYADEPNSSAS